MGMMEHDILKVLYTEEEIKARVRDLGARMYEDLKDKDPLFVSGVGRSSSWRTLSGPAR